MLKYPFTILICGAVAFATLLVGSPVAAHTQERETLSIRVSASGLDLADPSGASAMLTRIRNAAADVCNFEGVEAPGPCIRAKVDQAVASLGSPTVTAVSHAGR